MDEIQSKNLNNKPIVVKSDVYKEKRKENIDGENVYVYTKLKKSATKLTIKEKTVYRVKSILILILGALLAMYFYIKPQNIKVFISSLKIMGWNLIDTILLCIPMCRESYIFNYKYNYSLVLIYFLCLTSSLFITILNELDKHYFFWGMVFIIGGVNIEYLIVPHLANQESLFWIISTFSIFGLTLVLYFVLFIIITIVQEIVDIIK